MPILGIRRGPQYQAPKESSIIWDNFRAGLNTLLAPTEIESNEVTQMDNLMLVGRGIPKKRFGTANYFLTYSAVATDTMRIRGLKMVKFASGTSGVLELLALSDSGYLVRRNGASYTILPGYSYASGYDAQMAQIFNRVFVVNGQNALTKYNGVSIATFTSLSLPTNLTATNVSGVSGVFTYNWMVTAVNEVGETLTTSRASLSNLPLGLISTAVRLAWTNSSPASSVVGYNIYGRDPGFETYITTVPAASATVVYFDDGRTPASSIALPPEGDTTGGPIFKYITTHKDKIIGANVDISPSRVVWSGGGQYIDRFHWSVGGGYVEITPDDGEVITGVIDSFDSIIVFKERSIWKITLAVSSSGIVTPTISLITRAIGCAAPKTVRQVENDIFFLSTKGVYVLGNEPNIIGDILRTNELSAKVRSIFSNLNAVQRAGCVAIYHDNKYRIAYPSSGSATNNREVWYDRERLAWVGPMLYGAASPQVYEVWVDGDNNEHLIWGDSNDNYVTEYGSGFKNDKGVAISTTLVTKKELFKDPFLYKRINKIFTNWRNTGGDINVNILVETRAGQTVSARSFSITPTSSGVGWGFDRWGRFQWGDSEGAGSGPAATDLVRWLKLAQTARGVQFEVITTAQTAGYELLSIKITYRMLGESVIPASTRVT